MEIIKGLFWQRQMMVAILDGKQTCFLLLMKIKKHPVFNQSKTLNLNTVIL